MEYIFLWILFGVVAAVIGAGKGRSAFGFFFLGLLLGPFGVIIALVMKKDQKIIEAGAISSGESRKCPFCAELIKREATICKHCRSKIEEPSEDTDFCTYNNSKNVRLAKCDCGHPLSYDKRFSGEKKVCPNCSNHIVLP